MGILINSFDSFPATASDSLALSGLEGYYKSSDIGGTLEDDALTSWTDSSGNSNDLSGTGTLHFDSVSGNRQVRFDGVDEVMEVSANTIYDYTPQTDEFTIVCKLGETEVNDGNAFIGKQYPTAGNRQYEIGVDVEDISIYVGGTSTNTGGTNDYALGNDLVIMTVSTTTAVVRWNGVERINNGTGVGTGTNSDNFAIGGRVTTSFETYVSMDMEFVAIYNRVLTAQEISDIETEYNDN